jgi:hypothetical protein
MHRRGPRTMPAARAQSAGSAAVIRRPDLLGGLSSTNEPRRSMRSDKCTHAQAATRVFGPYTFFMAFLDHLDQMVDELWATLRELAGTTSLTRNGTASAAR